MSKHIIDEDNDNPMILKRLVEWKNGGIITAHISTPQLAFSWTHNCVQVQPDRTVGIAADP